MAKVDLTLEEQLAALTKKATDQDSELKEKTRTIQLLNGKLDSQGKELADTASKLTQVTTEVGQKVEEIRQLKQEAEATEAVVAGYEAKLRVADAAGNGSLVVSHNDQLYRVVVPQFHFEGQKVLGESLKTDATLVAKLVEAGSGVLEAVKA